MSDEPCVEIATAADLPAVLAVQREAFGRVAEELGIDASRLPPLLEGVGDLEQLASTGWTFFVARDSEGLVIDTVRAAPCAGDRGRIEIGRLAVASGWQRRGVARALMASLERAYPDASAFELFTGHDAIAPLALYESLGYARTRSEFLAGGYELVWLEKRVR